MNLKNAAVLALCLASAPNCQSGAPRIDLEGEAKRSLESVIGQVQALCPDLAVRGRSQMAKLDGFEATEVTGYTDVIDGDMACFTRALEQATITDGTHCEIADISQHVSSDTAKGFIAVKCEGGKND
jgi:hypothetical protein